MTFLRACAVADVLEGTALPTVVDGLDVAIVHTEGQFYAIFDECSHAAVALSEGEVDGCHIECYMHGSRFDLRTGYPDALPATEPVPVYPVAIDNGDVYVDLDHPYDPEATEEN